MPIVNEKKGHTTFREAQLGTGDVIIMKAKHSDERSYDNLLLFVQDGSQGPIGRDAGYAGSNTDEIPMTAEPISLRFEKSASVRIVIEDLLEIEQNLIADGK